MASRVVEVSAGQGADRGVSAPKAGANGATETSAVVSAPGAPARGPGSGSPATPRETPTRGGRAADADVGKKVEGGAGQGGATEKPGHGSGGTHWWVWLLVIGMLCGVGFLVWHAYTQSEANKKAAVKPAERPLPVSAAAAESEDVPVYLQALGTVVPFNTVTVRSRVDGQLMKVNFTEGQTVKAGESLGEIDPRPFEVALGQAQGQLQRDEASLLSAQQDLQRYQAAQEAISQQQIDQAAATVGQFEAALKIDQAAIQNAQLNISYCHITAPISGRVGLRQVDVGNMVHAADANGLVVITQVQPIAVLFSLPQEDLRKVLPLLYSGKKPEVDVYDQDSETKLAVAELVTLDNKIDPTTGTAQFKATQANDPPALFPNQSVNVKLLVDVKKGATVVPSAAVQQGPSDWYVFVVDENSKAQMRTVTPGLTEGERTIIEKGLSPGEMVITAGIDKVQADTAVSVRQGSDTEEAASGPATGSATAPAGRSGRGRGGRRGGGAAATNGAAG